MIKKLRIINYSKWHVSIKFDILFFLWCLSYFCMFKGSLRIVIFKNKKSKNEIKQ